MANRPRPSPSTAASSFKAAGHDHQACVEQALERAAEVCARRGSRLTDLRRRVLQLIWNSHAPVGAYDLLEQLSREQGRTAPPTVYRALDFLLAEGLVHRVESLSAFVGCADPGAEHGSQFLICTDCGNAAELDDPRIERAIAESSSEQGFSITRKTVELQGLCPDCRAGRRAGTPDGR